MYFMMDDLDRGVCADAEKYVVDGMGEKWELIDREFNDPGMLLVFEHTNEPWWGGKKPKVTITIEWGDKLHT